MFEYRTDEVFIATFELSIAVYKDVNTCNLPIASQTARRIQVAEARWNIRKMLISTLMAGMRGTNGT